jgi:hypothetical protein
MTWPDVASAHSASRSDPQRLGHRLLRAAGTATYRDLGAEPIPHVDHDSVLAAAEAAVDRLWAAQAVAA